MFFVSTIAALFARNSPVYTRAVHVRQGTHGRAVDVRQGTHGRAVHVRQGTHGRAVHVRQGTHGRAVQVRQGTHGRMTSEVMNQIELVLFNFKSKKCFERIK